MNNNDPKSMVEKGYDRIARTYHEQRDKFKSDALLAGFCSLVPPGGDVPDGGCCEQLTPPQNRYVPSIRIRLKREKTLSIGSCDEPHPCG